MTYNREEYGDHIYTECFRGHGGITFYVVQHGDVVWARFEKYVTRQFGKERMVVAAQAVANLAWDLYDEELINGKVVLAERKVPQVQCRGCRPWGPNSAGQGRHTGRAFRKKARIRFRESW